MTKQECAIVMAYTGTVMLTGDNLGIYYKYLEKILGRPVWTHELADKAVQNTLIRYTKDLIPDISIEAAPKNTLERYTLICRMEVWKNVIYMRTEQSRKCLNL